ncbi:MAG: hypothetical protein V7L31_24430 [Nostoc sp.]
MINKTFTTAAIAPCFPLYDATRIRLNGGDPTRTPQPSFQSIVA